MKFSANLSWLFTEYDFADRFEAAAKAGFEGVEYLFPYAFDAEMLAEKLKEHALEQVLFNLSPGDWDAGERGLAILPDRRDDFVESVEAAIGYAQALNCKRVHCMAGLIPDDADLFALESTYVSNLRFAATETAKAGIDLLIEPINSFDMPGYYLNYVEQAASLVEKVDAPNLFIQYDIYHAQRMTGELARTFDAYRSMIGHIQIADNPGRHEPGTGEINYDYLFSRLKKQGYSGWIGCEYQPAQTTEAGLDWLKGQSS